jgi:Ammonium Transporter Family
LTKLKVDDVVLGIPIHFFCGVWSMIATGLFSSPSAMMAAYGRDEHVGLFYELGRGSFDATLLTNQFIAILGIFGWIAGLMYPFFRVLDKLQWLKASIQYEIVGLDEKYMSNNNHEAQLEIQQDVQHYKEQVKRIKRRRMRKNSEQESVCSLNVPSENFNFSTIESVDTLNLSCIEDEFKESVPPSYEV